MGPLPNHLSMDENRNRQMPFARACIRKGKVTLNRWSPRLIRGGAIR